MTIEKELTSSKRIAINTIVSYARTIVSVFLVLFSSRWILHELGSEDFGLYNLIGSILLIVVFLNTVISNGDSRFFAISIGNGNQIELSKVFNTSLSIHLFIPIIIIGIGIFIGEWAIREMLVVPLNRLNSTIWVFRITMFSSFFTMITVPFSALFIAHQNIAIYTLISLTQTILVFLSAYLLRFFNCDKLILYACFVAVAQIITYSLQIIIASKKYTCAKINISYFFNKKYTTDILKYSFWNMLGDLGHLVRTQGISIIVNIFFGPNGNAALGIANQVSMQACNLTNAMSSATSPEIFKRVGEGKYESALKMSEFISKVGIFLMCFLGIPIALNIDSILALWLVDVPEGASILCLCFIYMFIIEKLSLGQHKYLSAIGKVALVNCLIFAFYCSALILPFCGFMKYGLLGIGISCIISMSLTRVSIVYCMAKYTNYKSVQFIKNIFTPVLIVVTLYLIAKFYYIQVFSNLFALLCLCTISCLVVGFVCFFIIFTKKERSRLINLILSKLNK